jgi:hypothetical protein
VPLARPKYHLRSRFQLSGKFWSTGRPDSPFSAIVTSNGKYIELQTSAEFVTPEESFLTGSSEPVPDIVHGFTEKGECTLIGFQEMSAPGLIDFPKYRGVQTRKYRVGACVVGCYLESDKQPLLDSISLRFSGISSWFPAPTRSSFIADGVNVFFPSRPLTIVDLQRAESSVRVLIKVIQSPTFAPGGRATIPRSEAVLVIEAPDGNSLEWFVDISYRFENFFSLCLGTSVRLNSMSLMCKGHESALVLHRKGRAQKPDLRIWITADSSELGSAITAWLSASEEFRFLENLIYGAIRHSSLFVETEFLLLAQALESLHRLTEHSTVEAPAFFRQILKSLCGLISKECGSSPIARRFLDSIRHANEPDLKTRIESLLSRITSEHAVKLLGDVTVFEQTLRQTRNHFTHAGIRRKSRVITRASELFIFNQRLHALLRLLMLMRVGFSEEKVFEPIYRQSRQWTVD